MQENKAGGYSDGRELEAHDKEVFEKAMNGILGVTYTPQQVATQVVCGTNYQFFCKYQTATAQPESGMAVVTIFEELPVYGGKVTVMDITRFHN